MIKKTLALGLVLATLLVAGCTTITNLTPSQQKRNASGFYPFAVALDTQKQSTQKGTIKVSLMIGNDMYPMEKSPGPFYRWETVAPISPDKSHVRFRYKFDYSYNSLSGSKTNSKLTPVYQVEIVDY